MGQTYISSESYLLQYDQVLIVILRILERIYDLEFPQNAFHSIPLPEFTGIAKVSEFRVLHDDRHTIIEFQFLNDICQQHIVKDKNTLLPCHKISILE